MPTSTVKKGEVPVVEQRGTKPIVHMLPKEQVHVDPHRAATTFIPVTTGPAVAGGGEQQQPSYAQHAQQSVSEIAAALKNKGQAAEEQVFNKTANLKQTASTKAGDVQSGAADVKNVAYDKASEVQNRAVDVKNATYDKASDIKNAAYDKASDVQNRVSSQAADVKNATYQKAGNLQQKVSETQHRVAEKIPSADDVKHTAYEQMTTMQEKASDLRERVARKTPSIAEVKDVAAEKSAFLKQKGLELQHNISHTARDVANSPWAKYLALAGLAATAALATVGTVSLFSGAQSKLASSSHNPLSNIGSHHQSAKSEYHILDVLRSAGWNQRFSFLEKIGDREGWLLQVDVPGLERGEVSVQNAGPVLKIRGTHECPKNMKGGSKDSTCVERYLKEDIMFPDDADMNSARASIEKGVLHVRVKPLTGRQSSGRVIQIMDSVKEKLGFQSPDSLPIAHFKKDAKDDTWTGSWTEAKLRETLGDSFELAKTTLRVPMNKQVEFTRAVKQNVDSLFQTVNAKTMSPTEIADKIFQISHDTWETMKSTGAAGQFAAEDAGRKVKFAAEDTSRKAKDSVMGTVENVQDQVGSFSDAIFENMKFAQDSASAGANYVQESAKYVQDTASSSAKYVADRASEAALRAQDRVRENVQHATNRAAEASQYAKNRAAEVVQSATHTAQETDLPMYSAQKVAGVAQQVVESLKDTVVNSAQSVKEAVIGREAPPPPKGFMGKVKEVFAH